MVHCAGRNPQLAITIGNAIRVAFEQSLMATHEMQFARKVADTVVFLKDGVLIEQGTPEQIFATRSVPRRASI